jgi:mRNA interferase HigB
MMPKSVNVQQSPGRNMHVITRKRLNEFAARHPETRSALEHWYREMKRRNFASFAELRSVFPTADQVGKLTVFNIGGNRVRLVAAMHYNRRRVYIRAVLTHVEYDAGTWKE